MLGMQLLQIQYRLQGDAVLPLGTAVENQNIHTITPCDLHSSSILPKQ
jgi:hypothetical protein